MATTCCRRSGRTTSKRTDRFVVYFSSSCDRLPGPGRGRSTPRSTSFAPHRRALRRRRRGWHAADSQALARSLSPGTALAFLLIEHGGAQPLFEAIAETGGALLGEGSLTPETGCSLVPRLQRWRRQRRRSQQRKTGPAIHSHRVELRGHRREARISEGPPGTGRTRLQESGYTVAKTRSPGPESSASSTDRPPPRRCQGIGGVSCQDESMRRPHQRIRTRPNNHDTISVIG